MLFTDPKHPYTNMLMAAFARTPTSGAGGTGTSPRALPAPAAGPPVLLCRALRQSPADLCHARPEMRALRSDHLVRCLYPVER